MGNVSAVLNFNRLFPKPVSRKFLGIVGQDPSDFKFSRLHVDIFRFWCFHSFEVYSVDSSKIIGMFSEVLNFHRYVSNSTGSSGTNC